MSVTGPAIICQGSFALYTDSTVGGVWSMSNINATVTGTGVVTGITSGTDIITYTYTNACGTATATKTITITTLPTITPITGLTTVCAGATITLADATAGGTWSRTNTKATVTGTGVVTGITTGIDTIIYAVTNSCGTTRDSMAITINTIPSPGIISGAAFVCVGSIGTYTESVAGGVWTITNANATIATSAGDGVVSGIVLGMDTIIYTVTTACGTSATSKPISINPYPVAGVISGPLAVCTGTTISLTETMPGGVWSSGDIALATVSGTGVVTGLATGTDTISYTISGGCAVVGTWATIEVTALPNTSTITGPTAVCIGSSIMLTDTASGGTGTWINGSSHGSISSTGLFTGLTHGTDLVSYALTNMCGTGYATSLITVDTFPTAGFISWTDGVCVGSAVTLIDTTPGGIWVASNGNAMILALGIIWGVSPGIDTIFYIVTNSCGTADAIKILPVNALPVVAAITGATEICVGSITSLTDATTGGVWASSNSSIATIDIETGLVDGVAPGVVTITYTVTNSLGCPSSATLSLTVDAIPVIPAITGTTHQCVGTTTTLSDATAGGTWSSSNTVIATIDATGMVSGVTAGIVTITYTVTNICGTTNITKADTVNALPTIAPIISATSECVGANATLTDATPSGVWNSTDTTIATINPTTGVVTGVAAGTVNINYTVTNTHGCSASISISNTVNPLPVVLPITGITNECLTNTAMLADATVGGTWSSSNTAIASIDATGLVTGNAGGIVTISYSTTNSYGCVGAATTYDTVNTVPVATTITGTMHVCIGATTTLADASLWGVWTSATPTTATINAANGVITGVAAGTDIINYTVTNPCGMVIDTALITVYALPIVSPITGATITICAGASTVLSDETTGGTWSSSNTAIATVNSTTGVVTGVVAGADTIIYTVTNTNGCSISTTYPLTFGSYLGTSSVVPSSGTICGGHAVYMHVVTSAGSLTYQWLRNGVAIAGATNYNYTTDSVGSYSVIIGNGVCEETLTGTMVTLMATAVINFTAPNMLYTGSYASYQWYRNGIAIPGATNSIYFETLPGNYSVGVTDANGCSQTTNSYTIHGSGSSAVSIVGNNEDIRIYPNPATSMLFVDAPQPVNITIICADGRKVIEQPNTQSVNVSTLADGMYIIMLYIADGLLLKTDKFVKRN